MLIERMNEHWNVNIVVQSFIQIVVDIFQDRELNQIGHYDVESGYYFNVFTFLLPNSLGFVDPVYFIGKA